MEETDLDTVMIAAGLVLSLIAVLEFYSDWKTLRSLSATED